MRGALQVEGDGEAVRLDSLLAPSWLSRSTERAPLGAFAASQEEATESRERVSCGGGLALTSDASRSAAPVASVKTRGELHGTTWSRQLAQGARMPW